MRAEVQRRPREVQRRRIHQGTHKRPEVRTATKKNIDFTCVFTAPCLGGVSLSIRLCREAARAQISRAMPKISEDWPGKCLAWKTMRFTDKNHTFSTNGLRENELGNDKCRTVVPPRPVREVGNIFSEAKLLFMQAKPILFTCFVLTHIYTHSGHKIQKRHAHA